MIFKTLFYYPANAVVQANKMGIKALESFQGIWKSNSTEFNRLQKTYFHFLDLWDKLIQEGESFAKNKSTPNLASALDSFETEIKDVWEKPEADTHYSDLKSMVLLPASMIKTLTLMIPLTTQSRKSLRDELNSFWNLLLELDKQHEKDRESYLQATLQSFKQKVTLIITNTGTGF